MSEWLWLEARETVDAQELCRVCRVSVEELREIVGYGVPTVPGREADTFGADWLMPLREAARLRRDFDLDLFSVSLVARYLHRIDALEHELRGLRARLPGDDTPPGP